MTPKELCAELFDRAACLRVGVATDEIKTADYLDRAGMMIEELEKQSADADSVLAIACEEDMWFGREDEIVRQREARYRHTHAYPVDAHRS